MWTAYHLKPALTDPFVASLSLALACAKIALEPPKNDFAFAQ
jgi:hypothetical protein